MLLTLSVARAEDLSLPRVERAGIVVDGRATEAAWAHALELPPMVVYQPSSDVEPVGPTRVRVLMDEAGLYVHFDAVDPEPALVRAGLGRRDGRDSDDMVGIELDPGGEGRRGYFFFVNPLGVQLDARQVPGTEDDWSWDADWRSAGHRTPTGYEVELAIPWAALHMSGAVDRLGVLSARYVPRKGQDSAWPRVEPNTSTLQYAAKLRVPGELPRRIGLEIRPELTGSWSDPHVDTGRLEWYGLGPGLTLRYAPTSTFGAVGTFNPDFSQLESDATQIDVNQRYALSYDEKRPFFLEGQDWFSHPMNGMVYTRSMNAPLYGLRATGEIGRVGLAALHTMDMAPPASVNEGGGWTEAQLDGHVALASLGRARVSLGGDSYVGLLASDRTILDSNLANRVLGLDSTVRFTPQFTIGAAALASATTFSESDQPTLAPAGLLKAFWSGERVYALGSVKAIAPGFRQENGFVTQSDLMGAATEAHYNLHPSEGVPLLALEPWDVWSYWTIDQAPRERGWDPSVWMQLGDGSFVKLDGRIAGEAFADAWIDYQNAELYVETSIGEGLRLEAGGIGGTAPYYDVEDPRAGRYVEGWMELAVQPIARLTLSVEPVVEQMAELDGAPLYLVWTGRAKAELFVDRSLWLRAVAQLEGDEGGVGGWRIEPVLGWEWTPGRAAYLGGAYGDDDGRMWQVFAKLGWVFDL